jgi:hypothetical protein
MQVIEQIILGHACVQRGDDNVITLRIFGNAVIGHDEAREMNDAIGALSGGRESLILIMADEITQFSKEALAFSASAEGLRYTKADALVVKSLAQRITANFYLAVNAPPKPSKIFNSEAEARKWLLSVDQKKGTPNQVLNMYL